MPTTHSLPIQYRVDGQTYDSVVATDSGLETPDGTSLDGVAVELSRRLAPAPDSDCNAFTSDGSLCGLSANWGRSDPVETNVGRCRYHKAQAVPDDGTAGGSDGTSDSGDTTDGTDSTDRTDSGDSTGDTSVTLPERVYDASRTAPVVIDATHYDAGGWGDDDTRDGDSSFRPGDMVDIEPPSKGGTGDGSIGYIDDGDHTEYSLIVPAGEWTLGVACASNRGGTLRVLADGSLVGTIDVQTDGWYAFTERQVGTLAVESERVVVLRVEGTSVNYDALHVRAAGTGGGEETTDATGDAIETVAYGDGEYGGTTDGEA